MFQPAYEQYRHTDENFSCVGSYWRLSPDDNNLSCVARIQAVKKTPEVSMQWAPALTKCEEDAQIGRRYVTNCEKSVGVVKCGYSDMLLFQDDIGVLQLADHAGLR
jgi:hypothetical protein